jgi:hypothetical protein
MNLSTLLKILLVSLLLCSCSLSITKQTPTILPTPTVVPICKGDVCIIGAYATLNNTTNTLMIEFNVTDVNGNVTFGDEPKMDDKITTAIFLVEGDVYLWGATVQPTCYSGNDIPWSKGKLATTCSYVALANQMQRKVKTGDVLRIEIIEFDLKQTVTVNSK